MAYYDLAGSRVRYEISTSNSNHAAKYTQYRARADITTTEYDTEIGVTMVPSFVYGKQKWGPQLDKVGLFDFYCYPTGGGWYDYYCNFKTLSFSESQDYQTIYPLGTLTTVFYKRTSPYTVTFNLNWEPQSGPVYVASGDQYFIRNTNDYSTSNGTAGSPTSSGALTITIPALASYALSYDANGGSGAPGAQTLYYGQNFTVSSTQPTRSGYTFRGWTDGSTQYSPGTTYTESKHTNLTLYAIWHKNPTITTKSISSSGPYYKGLTNCSITYSGASASDGASFTVKVKVGSNSSSGLSTANGTFTLTPQETGNVPVTITITDSLNASTSYSLSNITVNQYVAPSVVVNAERTTENGSISNDSEAKYGLIAVTFTVPSKAGYPLNGAPTIKLVRSDNVTINNPPVSWYSTRNTDKTVGNPFSNWGSITSGTTIYGIIGNKNTSTFCDPNYAYQVSVTPRDDNNQATKITKTAIIPPLFYTIDFLAGGKGIAFGAAAVNDGFYCKMNTTFGEEIYIELDTGESGSVDSQLADAIGNLNWNNIL